jgi:K+-sensing histidine kinase KdpD
VIEACVGQFRERHPWRAFNLRHDNGDALVTADATVVDQVITNLLSNAVKYSPAPAPIDVHIIDDGAVVRIHVLDRGPGIPADEQDKVLEPFYRSTSTSAVASGVGVGLTVCRRLVEAAGGELWVAKRPGGGADIGFTLPLLLPEDER